MAVIKPPFLHQTRGTTTLVTQPAHALFFRPRLGKTRTVIDAAAELWKRRLIQQMLVVAPAEARSVWADPDPMLGEMARWWPLDQRPEVREYRASMSMTKGDPSKLRVLVSNPEFIRRPERLKSILGWVKRAPTLLVADESWAYQHATSQQSKALYALGKAAARKVILNGTPGTMEHAYGQYRILDPHLFGVDNWWQYRAKFLKMGGYMQKEIVGFQNEDLFERLTAPITTYLTREDVFEDIPPARLQIEVPLTPPTWKLYQEMKRDCITWLTSHLAATAAHAGAKVMRLAQLCNGIVGGIEVTDQGELFETERGIETTRDVSREKIDGLLAWLAEHPREVPAKVVTFARFKLDVTRTAAALAEAYPTHQVRRMFSDASPEEKRQLKALFVPGGDPAPAFAVVNAQSGGAGLALAASSLAVFLGHEYSARLRDQAEQRVQGPDQGQVTYLDVLATGPRGERTIDHVILSAQRSQFETAAWTAEMWRRALTAEDPIL